MPQPAPALSPAAAPGPASPGPPAAAPSSSRPTRLPLPPDPASLPPPVIRGLRRGRPLEPLPLGVPGPGPGEPRTGAGTPAGPRAAGELVAAPVRPPRPQGATQPRPEDLLFEVERPGGVLKRYPQGDGSALYVMVGNPRLFGQAHRRADGKQVEALSIKASTFVAWVDERALPEFSRLSIPGAATPGAGGPTEKSAPSDGPVAQLFEDAVLGIYAEGAVEVIYGTIIFRAEALYLEPRTFKGLLLEASFDGRLTGKGLEQQGVPVHVRAPRVRLVAKGLMVFDDAEVSTNRADDRILLRVRSLTVEQMEEEGRAALAPESPALLGFRSLETQRFRARDIRVRGERVPLGYLPYASFGTQQREPFPMTLKRADAGNRSSLGVYGFLGLGGDIGPEADPWLEWIVDLGGYTKRGGAGGVELAWRRPRSVGTVQGWGVFFDQGEDRTGYDPAGEPLRGRLIAESRTQLAQDLLFDAEFATFTDRGFDQEFFERENLTHKDRESYGRLLYRRPSFAGTLTGKWHEREFVTETVEAPQAALWVGSVPLLTPTSRGGLGVDLTSVSGLGRLGRRFDRALPTASYDALRADTDTRLNAGVDVGDLRLSGFAGVSADSYQERSDGAQDLTRTALLAGLQANLQLQRVFPGRGGVFELDGLRHVADVDALLFGRFFDSANPTDVPFFDEREQQEQRTQVTLRARNRLQTRRGSDRPPRDLLDLETSFSYYVVDVAPYLQDNPWSFDWALRGEPKADGRLIVGAEGWVDGDVGLRVLTAAVGYRPIERLDLAVAYRYLKDEAAAPLVSASWRWSERYEVRVTESFNFRDERNFFRIIFRRFSQDHIWSFGVSLRDADDVGFALDFRPIIGGATGATPSVFESEVDLDPLGVFR